MISIIPDPKIALYFPVNVSAIYPPNTGTIKTEPEILLIFDHICSLSICLLYRSIYMHVSFFIVCVYIYCR